MIQTKKYIYLDWNVIQYMKHENEDKKGKEFKELVKKLSNKYKIQVPCNEFTLLRHNT